MKRTHLIAVGLLLGALSAHAQTPPAAASAPALKIDREVASSLDLTLEAGQNRLLILSEEIGRVAVAQPEVADLKVVTPNQLLLTARGVGNTDLTLWNRSNQPLVINLRVGKNLDGLRKQLKELFPDEKVEISSSGDLLVLTGEVSDVRIPERVAEVARLHSREVANLIKVTGNQQVQLEVRFAEVSRTALREMGVNFFHKSDTFNRVAGMSGPGTNPGSFLNTQQNPSIPGAGARSITGTGLPPDVYAPQFNNAFSLFFSQTINDFPFSVMVNLLETNGLAKVLAEPTLVTLTGQEARFLAGGELPIPLSSALGQVSVTWKKFGILLGFTPTVIGEETIHLKMATEVSEIDPTISVSIQGTTIPGFASRQGETTVRLGDGQSFAIAGLLSDKTRSNMDKVPGLGSIPVLGALFRSTYYQRNETELMVVVTARLVRPLNPNEVPPLPTAWKTHPSDADLFFLGKTEGPAAALRPSAGPAGQAGFQR